MAVQARRAGVGLVLEARGRGPSFVAELAPGGSADRSGRVRVGDQLLRVDGQMIQGLTPADLSQIISGPEGTAVRLAFRRITSNFFAENEDNFEVTLVRSVPQALAPQKYTPPAGQQAPLYQETVAPMDANGSYMGDATVLPINYASQDGAPAPGVASQRRPLDEQPRPTTFHGFPNELQQRDYMPEHYSSSRNSVQTSPQAERRPPQFEEARQPMMTATGTPARLSRAAAPAPVPAEGFAAPPAADSAGGGSGRKAGSGGEGGPSMMELEAELQTLLTFVKSGYTNATHQESEWMQGESGMAELVRTIYREIGTIKSREASSENVLRVAKETLDARKKQIRTLTVTLKKLQGQKSLSGMGLSGSMDGANQLMSSDNPGGEDGLMRELQERESKAQEVAATTKRKLDRALMEISDLREKLKARGSVNAAAEDGDGDRQHAAADVLAGKDEQIHALEEKLRFLEEDHRQRSERITEVSERLMLKRKEEREMIDSLRRQLAEKDDALRRLSLQANEQPPHADAGAIDPNPGGSFHTYGSHGYQPV